MNSEERIILPESDEAARLITVQIWKSSNGGLFTDERTARYDGSTHRKCSQCEKLCRKPWVLCEACIEAGDIKKYNSFPKKKWEGEMVYSEAIDEYFLSLDEAEESLSYLESDTIKTLSNLRLVICEPIYARYLEEDYFYDDLAEEGEFPEWLVNAIEEFNETIRANNDPLSYRPGKIAVDLEG